ncbi:MAG: putative DNA binding domain-containing protein [Lachnospiraceae bacterium]|jgi:predicted HTH transcriptional regulator|nr:putative DNA binding domain-containing protein [Lachnospiraceae bacterium]
MRYIESEAVELKEKFTDVICKDIVAFLNTSGGILILGVRDDGTVVGVKKIDETMKKISDVITMQIEPNPQDEIRSELKFEDGKTLIVVYVNKGIRNIYCQKRYGFSSSGCVVRVGTTCREMTPEQIRIRYEQNFIDSEYMLKKRSSFAELTFRELKVYYSEKGYHTDEKNFEANLNLRNEMGEYNLLAELLSDHNNIPFIFVKFQGKDKSSISERNDYGEGCLLTTYNKIKTRLEAENICISDTTVRPRKDRYLFDYDSVNEAVLNALVHNDWTITEPQISMFSDRIEIISHGGLPRGLSEKQFFEGISKPRNATLMRIFLSMGLTEHTGHGIPTIVSHYGTSAFYIEENLIRCVIPFDPDVMEKSQKNVRINVGINVRINATQKKVLRLLIEDPGSTAASMSLNLGLSARTIQRALSALRDKGLIERDGSNRNGTWKVLKQI